MPAFAALAVKKSPVPTVALNAAPKPDNTALPTEPASELSPIPSNDEPILAL